MCGIAGYVCTKEYHKSLDMIFPLMGVFMDSRGGDSWGYTDGTTIHKQLGELQQGWNPSFTGALQAAIHTRFGTTGAKTSDNSHPWDFGDGFIGMHNGVVDNHFELNWAYDRKCAVDSQNLLLHIKEGRDLGEVEAYGTVVFWRDGKLFLGSFNQGDLAVAKAPWGIVFASKDWAIDQAFRMTGEPEPTYYEIEQGVLYRIEDGELWVHDKNGLNVGKRTKTNTWQQGTGGALTGTVMPAPTHVTGTGCGWCSSDTRELYDHPTEGLLCGQCYRWASDDWGTMDEDDEPTSKWAKMTVRDWAKSHEIEDLPFDDPCMTSCDNCVRTLIADDICFVETEDKVEFILCEDCHAKEVLSEAQVVNQDIPF